jgi:hypothetical protein
MRLVSVLVLVLAAASCGGAIASAASPTDGYISGYAAAVLEREFHLPTSSLRVENGIITIHASDLHGVDRDAVIERLARIRGAVRVTVIDTAGTSMGQPAAPSAEPAVAASPGPKVVNELRTGLFPGEELLFKPLIADPRWPHFALAYQSYLNDKSLQDVVAVSFGESLSIYRDQLSHGWWEVGIQAGVFAFFDLDAASKDLVNADYFVAALGAYRYKHFSALARLFHQSSHLGDEFLLRSRVNRVNLSYEGADLKLSYEFFGDVLRVYGGGGYLFAREPSALKPASVQWGAEFRSPWPGSAATFRPIAAVDIQHREENHWQYDVSARAGVEIKGLLLGRNLQGLLEYFTGHSPNGQFYLQKINYIGLGLHFHF